MMALNDRQPIIVADAGPLIRLAAAGLLDTLRILNRNIILVDRVEDEVIGDLSKPFATEVRDWLGRMGDAVERVRTVYGLGIESLRSLPPTPENSKLLKDALRDSGEMAIQEFISRWKPVTASEAIVIYEDRKVATMFLEADYHLTLMTTLSFAYVLQDWGINTNAVGALEAVSPPYDLKPALLGEVDPDTPRDMRPLPRPMTIKVRNGDH